MRRTIDSENDDEVDEELILQCGAECVLFFTVVRNDNITNGTYAINAKKTMTRTEKARERNYQEIKGQIIRYSLARHCLTQQRQ